MHSRALIDRRHTYSELTQPSKFFIIFKNHNGQGLEYVYICKRESPVEELARSTLSSIHYYYVGSLPAIDLVMGPAVTHEPGSRVGAGLPRPCGFP
jgi:hypothetical protein